LINVWILQENTFFATTKVAANCQKLMQKNFTPSIKKSLLVVAISFVAKNFAVNFIIVAISNFPQHLSINSVREHCAFSSTSWTTLLGCIE
jgi:hypothetical protein